MNMGNKVPGLYSGEEPRKEGKMEGREENEESKATLFSKSINETMSTYKIPFKTDHCKNESCDLLRSRTMSSTARLLTPDQCFIHSPAQPAKSHMGHRRPPDKGREPGPGQPAQEEPEGEGNGEGKGAQKSEFQENQTRQPLESLQ